ncbi:MAG TPA: aminotransferase class IV [Dehalococcoidia bacterium]|nr:aminotransferase class IV [Dehalococcoidia bacterium]
MAWVYFNGRLLPEDNALVPAGDRGVLLGLGVFETFRARKGRVYRLDAHFRRLCAGAAAFGIEVPLDLPGLGKAVSDLARLAALDDARVRLTLTAGDPEGGPNLLIQARASTDYPEESYEAGIRLATAAQRRNETSPLARLKTTSFAENVHARDEARRRGADEALLLNTKGLVAEGSVTNVFAVIGREVVTPPVEDGALGGVTREAVLELAPDAGVRPAVRSLRLEDLLAAREVFVTNAIAGLLPVVAIDGTIVGGGRPGDITRRLRAAYEAAASLTTPGA